MLARLTRRFHAIIASAVPRTFLFGALFLAGISVFVWAITFSSSYQSCVAKEHDRQASQSEQGALTSIGILVRCEAVPLDKHAGALTAIGTFVIAFFTLTLWAVTNNALRLARDEFIASHRPKIVIHTVEVAWEASSENPGLGAEITYFNKGRSDAIITEFQGNILPRHVPPEPGTMLQAFWNGRIIVPPGVPKTLGMNSDLDARTVRLISGGAAVVCLGVIVYEDRLGNRRRTAFCRQYVSGGARERWVRIQDGTKEYEYSY